MGQDFVDKSVAIALLWATKLWQMVKGQSACHTPHSTQQLLHKDEAGATFDALL
jgi:hypothetical protein